MDRVKNLPLQGGVGPCEAYLLEINPCEPGSKCCERHPVNQKLLQLLLTGSRVRARDSLTPRHTRPIDKGLPASIKFDLQHREWRKFSVMAQLHAMQASDIEWLAGIADRCAHVCRCVL